MRQVRQHNTLAAVKLTASIVEKFIPPRARALNLYVAYVYHGAPILASLAALSMCELTVDTIKLFQK